MQCCGTIWPLAMPRGGADHAIHHTMLEMRKAFTEWEFFHQCLNAISKFVRTWFRLRGFRATCLERTSIFSSARLDSFSDMFTSACPTLVEHRWEYAAPSMLTNTTTRLLCRTAALDPTAYFTKPKQQVNGRMTRNCCLKFVARTSHHPAQKRPPSNKQAPNLNALALKSIRPI